MTTDHERATLEKLLHADEAEAITFTRDEAEILQRFAKTLLGFEAMERLAGAFKTVMLYVGWAVATYLAIKTGFLQWVRENL